MDSIKPLPRFQFRADRPSLGDMFRLGVGDVGAVIPASILDEPAVRLTGPGAPLVVSSPQLVREVLGDRADHFTRDRFMRRLLRRAWGKGLAAAEGEDWQRQRRAAVPFFRPQQIRQQLARFAAASDAVIDRAESGKEVNLTAFSAQIIARIVLSAMVDAGGLADPDKVAADIPGYIRRIGGFTMLDLLPLPEKLIDRLHAIDSDPAVQRLRALAQDLAQARKDGVPRDDMIALLEGVGPIADNIGGLLPAAMDTTVAALGWALYTLALHPEWQDRVSAEGRAMDLGRGLDQIPVTRRVVSEVLRLFPPGPLLARRAARAMDLGDHRTFRGQTVIIAIYAMQRHNRVWDRPDQFDPDRFLADRVSEGWMPFGTGPRMCIAAQFAQAEVAVILARVLARLRIEPGAATPEVSLQTNTHSLNGLPATLTFKD